ncbi:MAG: hypothetical protein U0821_25125 [Chloroflexota bacterium]
MVRSSFRRRVAVVAVAGFAALSMLIGGASVTSTAYADWSGDQWQHDYGHQGAEVPGQPPCFLPAPDQTRKREYNLQRPACFLLQ